MAPDLFEVARLKYKDRVPRDCFVAKLPDWLEYTPDNTVAPSLDLSAKGSVKFIRASKYREFIKAVRSFARYHGPSGVESIELQVIIMPYMPLVDAFNLHQHILEPDLLPDTFEETVKNIELSETAVQGVDGTDLGLANLLKDQEDEEDEEGESESDSDVAIQWELKRGSVSLDDVGATVDFTVVNYSLLWAKSEKYCLFMFMADPLKDFLARLKTCDKLFHKPPVELLHAFNDKLERARRQLIFAMYENDVNPHDALHSFYPHLHNQVYQGCVHCNPNIAEADAVDSPDTMERLLAALNGLGLDQFAGTLTVEDAEYNLMKHEGLLESFMHNAGVMKAFSNAEENFRIPMQAALLKLNLATIEASVMGVGSMDLHEE